MNAVLAYVPLVVAVFFVLWIVATTIALFRRAMSPRELLLRSGGAGSLLAVLGLAGLIPSQWWWAVWLLTVALLLGIGVATWRTLRGGSPSGDPGWLRVGLELAGWVVLLAAAVVAGT